MRFGVNDLESAQSDLRCEGCVRQTERDIDRHGEDDAEDQADHNGDDQPAALYRNPPRSQIDKVSIQNVT